MCLVNTLNEKELREFKKTLPEVFPVWKVTYIPGMSEFFTENKNEQMLNKKGIYFARNCENYRRMKISYKPGFHAFLSGEEAKQYHSLGCSIEKFQAKRSWIKIVGKIRCTNIQSVVLSKIEVT